VGVTAVFALAGVLLCTTGVGCIITAAMAGLSVGYAAATAAPGQRPQAAAQAAPLSLLLLRARGLRVAYGPVLRDVDTAADALHVAALCAGGPFPAAVAAHVPWA
jgi:hypothetical protein